jgi:hypothetical protein
MLLCSIFSFRLHPLSFILAFLPRPLPQAVLTKQNRFAMGYMQLQIAININAPHNYINAKPDHISAEHSHISTKHDDIRAGDGNINVRGDYINVKDGNISAKLCNISVEDDYIGL